MTKNELMQCNPTDDGVSFLIEHKNMRTVKFWVFDIKKGRKKRTLQFGYNVTGMWWCNQLHDVLMHTKETIFISKQDLQDWDRHMVQFKV